MSVGFVVDRVALHFIDTSLEDAKLSTKEINLKSSDRSEDIEVLDDFFKGHLEKIWLDKESQKTCAATFKDASNIRDFYAKIIEDTSQFFDCTCEMAQQLHLASPNTASKGILMVLLFSVAGEPSQFLGLLKMDPGRKDAITLGEDKEGNVLLDLAVRTIKQALPDPQGEKILKWAVIPHPTRRTFQLKVKDEQGGIDRAKYFMKFLGCEERPSAIEQTQVLVDVLRDFAEEKLPKSLDYKIPVNSIVEKIAESDTSITLASVVEAVKQSGNFGKFDEEELKKKFEDANAVDICIPPEKLRDMKIQYKLSNGITIKGPRGAMENYLKIETKDTGKVVIQIESTTDYEIKYV
ncbi:MAG: nucleoid-associated protein [Methanothrix sp.]